MDLLQRTIAVRIFVYVLGTPHAFAEWDAGAERTDWIAYSNTLSG